MYWINMNMYEWMTGKSLAFHGVPGAQMLGESVFAIHQLLDLQETVVFASHPTAILK